jgi:hypothetical protein
LPSAGAIHQRLNGPSFDADAYDRELIERMRTSLY